MTIQQAVILGLVVTTNYDYRYGLLAGHNCRTGFSASCGVSLHDPVYIRNKVLVLLRVTPGL
jgi:hypothetical protein